MTPLAEILKQKILAQGPVGVDEFMALALGHPDHGYYMKRDPFGVDGDFTTAPEISQMFGEMIGAWAADVWAQMGSPSELVFLECGPGRGTLMADMMRATKKIAGLQVAARIHLLEMSPVLREKQRDALRDYKVQWFERFDEISFDAPFILIANEFLDALPVKQVQGSQERLVNYSDEKGFHFSFEGEILEVSPTREEFTKSVAKILKRVGGAALFIDYGHLKSAPGNTLQALYKHEYISIFDHIGDADITSHVDFEAIGRAAHGVDVHGPVTQGDFLRNLGIGLRASVLAQASGKPDEIQKALHRLTYSDEMGTLFKVMGLSHGLKPAGF
jgi:NADH dehydrogenase [ubiquinone] 1 alpha subcomplex assembly factor 7